MVLINTRRYKSSCLLYIKKFLSRLSFRKPYNRPSGEGNVHPLVLTAPLFPGGDMALRARFGENRMFFIRLDMKENQTTSLRLKNASPSAFSISPGGGDVLRTYHSYLQPLSSIDRISQNRYFIDGKFALLYFRKGRAVYFLIPRA